MVDADLAADRAVNLREQRRWHVDERHAAQKCRGREPCHIADDAAADGDDGGPAIGLGADQCVVDPTDRAEMLEAFAVRQQDRIFAGDGVKAMPVQPPQTGTRDDETPAGHAVVVQRLGQTIGAAGGNVDAVRS